MDTREILTRFKGGTLRREHAVALLGGAPAPPAAPPAAPSARPGPAARPAAADHAPPPGPGAGGGVEPCAVVGMQGRFPYADDLDAFWRHALEPRTPTAAPPRGGDRFADGTREFDAGLLALFGLDAAGAAALDPRERLLARSAWQTLESAGYAGARTDRLTGPDRTGRSIGVYLAAGPAGSTPGEHTPGEHLPGGPGPAGRLSRLLDLRGPSLSVDTGASSFLTALHLALGALRAGECEAALAGAVELPPRPAPHPPHTRTGTTGSDPGTTGTTGTTGTDPGSGAGTGAGTSGADTAAGAEGGGVDGGGAGGGGGGVVVVLLKPLAAARAAGDRVYAVIRAGAAGHPGRLGAEPHHARLVDRALAAAGLPGTAADPHGPGTGPRPPKTAAPTQPDGLPCPGGPDAGPVAPGAGPRALGIAVRESAGTAADPAGDTGVVAGAAALARAVGQLRHATLLPAPGRAAPAGWEPVCRDDGTTVPRRALVSVSGPPAADAVLVVEEAPPAPRPPARPGPPRPAHHSAPAELVLLSAATPRQLAATAGRFARWLAGPDHHGGPAGADLAAIAHELRLGRAVLRCRLAVVAHTVTGLAAQLAAFAESPGPGRHPAGVRSADLRDAGEPLLLDGLAETRAYLAALWQAGRLEQLTRLWLAGADICAVLPAHPGPAVIELPPTALQPQPQPESGSGSGPRSPSRREPERASGPAPRSHSQPESGPRSHSQPGAQSPSQSQSQSQSQVRSRSQVPSRSQHGSQARPVESEPGRAVGGAGVAPPHRGPGRAHPGTPTRQPPPPPPPSPRAPP
ncbi:beta-ketoacyl synthase N-terminal-like domain-containing protein, partial [Streptomyces fagopyri]|uniref:beta-ketoacyl synthase N-terminal-like domain-containing protein n=1 Tax=Streptomyces fagopyri TaxID=2662397 RepID=UPI0036BEC3F0